MLGILWLEEQLRVFHTSSYEKETLGMFAWIKEGRGRKERKGVDKSREGKDKLFLCSPHKNSSVLLHDSSRTQFFKAFTLKSRMSSFLLFSISAAKNP